MIKHGFAVLMVLCLLCLCACTPVPGTTGNTQASESTAPELQTITIAQALELCGEAGNITTDRYYIRATVVSVTNANYGVMTISDETGTISVYGTYSEDGSVPYSELKDKPYKGDEVLLSCILQNFNGIKEVKNAWLMEVTHKEADVDATEYTKTTVSEARDAAEGSKVCLTGIVAQITYADGMIPSGIYLVDETNSILVHDADLAQRVEIGNQITILAEKTWWVLASEANNAAAHGYRGSCQLENAILTESDNRTDKGYDHAWITESSLRTILNTPVSENITNRIYKVNALIQKLEGKGFVNYYFYDLDGVSGSYAYTQCGGEDFAWLDEFDGKICTVYLAVINAKSTATDCFYRLQPIQVIDEDFHFPADAVPQHIVEYYGIPQLQSVYSGDPMLELSTSISSSLLGFEGATLRYSSSDPSVLNFKEADGKLYLRGIMPGTATVTVTGTYQGICYSQSMDITIGGAVSIAYGSVQDAIQAPAGSEVTIMGIVGPSVVNQPGFYLIDESGAIPVYMGEDMMSGLKQGHEIIIRGIRDYRNPKDSGKCIGQSYIKDPVILTNHYGEHAYSTESFRSGVSLADFYNLNALEDHSTEVYVMTGKIIFEESAYYTSVKFTDGTTTVNIYCANAGQYSFLEAYAGQEVTVELAACNWNSKAYYTGCILAVYTVNGKVVNALNFQ